VAKCNEKRAAIRHCGSGLEPIFQAECNIKSIFAGNKRSVAAMRLALDRRNRSCRPRESEFKPRCYTECNIESVSAENKRPAAALWPTAG
jgi:hypothetical protein